MRKHGKIRRLMVMLAVVMAAFLCTSMTAFAGVTDVDTGTTETYTANTSVTVNGYKVPVVGETADTSNITITAKPEGSARLFTAQWRNVTTNSGMTQEATFEEGMTYYLEVVVVTEDGYLFSSSDDGEYAGEAVMTGTTCTAPFIYIKSEQALAVTSAEVTATEKAADPEEKLVPIYRLYLKSTGEHLYTSDYNEYRTLYTTANWGYEGIAWYSPTEGTGVYRLYQPGLKNHLYTTDKNEIKVLTSKYGWVEDNNGEPLYYSGGDVAIYRVYNKGLSGMHHLTTDANEYNTLPKYGWSQEGVQLYASKLGNPLTTTKYYGK